MTPGMSALLPVGGRVSTGPAAGPMARDAAPHRRRAVRRAGRLAALGLTLMLLAGCGTRPPLRIMACDAAHAPPVQVSADGLTASTRLRVLTYNIEGLAWPARSTGRAAQLREIGARLSAMREAGTGPDVVLFQEMFSGPAKNAVEATGYPAIVTGPRRTDRPRDPVEDRLPGKPHIKHGELGIHLTGSGLAIVSRYPIINSDRAPYGRRSCAGLDCLANKGVAMARIVIPGVPTPIDLYDTHMNSRGASRAPARRNLEAHARQALEASRFIDATHDDAYPVVFGGDFNMRWSEERWENFSRYQSLLLVHRVCADPASGCDVRMSWDGDEPWIDTQDLQFYWSGDKVRLHPVRVEAVFDGGETGPELSDHDGFMVTYELRWPVSAGIGTACAG